MIDKDLSDRMDLIDHIMLAIAASVLAAVCIFGPDLIDRRMESEPFAIPACGQCLKAGPVEYTRNDAPVLVHWRNPGETWK